MKKVLVSAAIVLAASVVVGYEVPANRRLTPEQQRERNARMNMKRFGGILRKANSAQGKVLFVNAQTNVVRRDMERALAVIDEKVHPAWEWLDAAGGVTDYAKALNDNGAAVGVFLIESKTLPSLLVAPETGWAAVNVAALGGGCDRATFVRRVRVEFLRAFAFAGGGCMMMRDPVVMRGDVIKPKDLDLIDEEDYGIDVLSTLERNLPLRGIMPYQVKTYKQACQEGWAPAPTNDVQKKIWDKIHAPPSKPIKITYDKDKQKPVVK